VGDNEDRWFMWYSGHHENMPTHTTVLPAAGSIGTPTEPSAKLSLLIHDQKQIYSIRASKNGRDQAAATAYRQCCNNVIEMTRHPRLAADCIRMLK
jgi:hypothetical protein